MLFWQDTYQTVNEAPIPLLDDKGQKIAAVKIGAPNPDFPTVGIYNTFNWKNLKCQFFYWIGNKEVDIYKQHQGKIYT